LRKEREGRKEKGEESEPPPIYILNYDTADGCTIFRHWADIRRLLADVLS